MPSTTNTPTPTVIRVEARELRPVTARIISYGSSSKIAGQATLYLLRVTRGGCEWYVARRYSEFRVLYDELKSSLGRIHGRRAQMKQTPTTNKPMPGCGHCRELARTFASMQFPSRFRLRSGFASTKEKIESDRMPQLNAFLQRLIETTQGLLADEDDDDDDVFEDTAADDPAHGRCEALGVIGEFLMLHERCSDADANSSLKKPPPHHHQLSAEIPTQTDNQHLGSRTTTTTTPTPTPTRTRRPRLESSGSVTFRVQELAVRHRPTSPLATLVSADSLPSMVAPSATSPNVLDEHELDELFLADYASPADDAVFHRQVDDKTPCTVTGVHMQRSASLRLSWR